MHFVNNFQTNLLINNDTFKFQRVIIKYRNKNRHFRFLSKSHCSHQNLHWRFFNAKRTIKTKSFIIIPTLATIKIPVIYRNFIPIDRDFLFEFKCYQNLGNRNGMFAHVVDANLFFVQTYNISPVPVHLPNKTRFGLFVEYE